MLPAYAKLIEAVLLATSDGESLIERLVPGIKNMQSNLHINTRCLTSLELHANFKEKLQIFNVSPQERNFAQMFVQECFSNDTAKLPSANEQEYDAIQEF